MKALLQRVRRASVEVDGSCVGAIDAGLLVFLGIEKHDDNGVMEKMLSRLLSYRVFADADGKMNLSLNETGGGLLLVSQFTLAADTGKGLRPSFSRAAPPVQAEPLYQRALAFARRHHSDVAAGVFGADMQISLINDGPVTFLLEM